MSTNKDIQRFFVICLVVLAVISFSNQAISQQLSNQPMFWMAQAKARISQNAWQKIPANVRPLIDAPKEYLEMNSRIMEVTRIETDEPAIGLLVKFKRNREELESIGARVGSQIGDIFTVQIPINRLGDLAAMENVVSIEPSMRVYPSLNASIVENKANLVHQGDYSTTPPVYSGYTGKDVLVVAIDSGIDWEHGDFINDSDGTSRILYIWDQTLIPQTGESYPFGFSYGVEYTQTDINDEIDGSPVGYVRTEDTNGHGTHVMGIIAGDGSSTGAGLSAYTYVGMAPRADILFVKTGMSNSQILDGIHYAMQRADIIEKPLVINLSVGSQYGAHDGTSLFDQAINNAVNTGKVTIVSSAGNEGTDTAHGEYIHAEGTVTPGATHTTTFTIPSYSSNSGAFNDRLLIDMWYQGGDDVNVKIITPNGYTWDASTGSDNNGQALYSSDGTINIDNAVSGIDPNNGDHKCWIQIFDYYSNEPPISGTWTITVTGNTITESGHYDSWIYSNKVGDKHVYYTSTSGSNKEIISTPGTAEEEITVAAHSTKTSWTDYSGTDYTYTTAVLNDIAYFSNAGPTRDDPGYITGRQKPDISASGFGVISARSSDASETNSSPFRNVDGVHLWMQGTSMSAPHVAGAVALMLEKDPTLNAQQVKTILTNSANSDSYTGNVPNYLWGYGKLDIYNAMQQFQQPQRAVNLSPSLHAWDEVAGEIASYILKVKNLGSLSDSYDLTVTGNVWPTSIWDATGTSQISNTGTIATNSQVEIMIKVQVSAGTAPSSKDEAIISATSVSNSSVYDQATVITRTPANIPWSDNFPTTTLDPTKWNLNAGPAEVNNVGRSEPSSPYSLNLNGDEKGGDLVQSQSIDLSGKENVVLIYYYERTGGGNSPETGDDLWVYYYDSSGSWVNLCHYLGSGSDMSSYTQELMLLPADAYHKRFKIRFRNVGTIGIVPDDWFVDDVSLFAKPTITVSPDSFEVTLDLGDSTTQILTIGNMGESDLNFRISRSFAGSALLSLFNLEPAKRNYPESYFSQYFQKGAEDIREGAPVLLGVGGPDNFGHYWIDSDETGGPAFQWEDISTVGNRITGLGDDTNVGPFPIGFSFPFYENTFTTFRFSTNGFISFTSSVTRSTNEPIPNDEVDNLIAPFWDDLTFSSSGNAYYHFDGEKLIIQYNNVPRFFSGGPYSFEIFLYPNGDIKYQYLSMVSRTEECTIGIQNSDGTDGLEIAFNTSYVHDNLAILISTGGGVDWLSVTPTSGTVAPHASQDISVKLNANDLILDYRANIIIMSNDPSNPQETVPVHLTVNPKPYYITISPPEQSLSSLPSDTVSYVLTISNRGTNSDNYGLSVTGNTWPTSIWDSTGIDQITNTGPVSSGSEVDMTVKVEIPTGVERGDVDSAKVIVVSSGDPTIFTFAMLITKAVKPWSIPWFGDFPITTLDITKWTIINGTPSINEQGSNEPSPPYSLELKGGGGGDEVESMIFPRKNRHTVKLL